MRLFRFPDIVWTICLLGLVLVALFASGLVPYDPLYAEPLRQFAPGDPRLRWLLPLDPRVHFALVCASRSCPPVALYTASALESQLDLAASAFISGGGVRADPRTQTVSLSKIFRWYQADFGGRAGVRAFVARYADEQTRALLLDPRVRVRYLPYDWTLNAAGLSSPASARL